MEAQTKNINYKKVSIYYMIGTLFNQGISFLTVPIFTRLLTTTDYGIVTTYNSWVSIISMIVSCALYMGIRAAFIDYKKTINEVMSTVTTFTLLNGIVLTGIVFFIAEVSNIGYSKILILICMIHSIGFALLQNYSMYLMMRYRYKLRTAYMILPNFIAVIISLIAILFFLKKNLYLGRIIPTALAQGIFGITTLFLVYRNSKDFFDKKYLKYTLIISLPLVLHGIALNILSQSDRLMITWLRNASETGIYSLIYNFSMIATVITTSLDGVWVPWFTSKLKNREINAINNRSKDYIEIMTVSLVGLILIGPEIVKFLADKRYWEGTSIIPPIVLANYAIFAYTLYVNIEHFYKKTIYITFNTLIAAGINFITNYMFIPRYGYVAAAYTTLFSYVAALFLHASYAKKMEKNLYPLRFFIFPIVKIILAVIIFYFFMNSIWVRWGLTIVFLLIEAVTHKDLVDYMLPFAKERFSQNK